MPECANSKEFIEAIIAELDDGYGIVPLIGTGVSAPSGVPILREIQCYLQRCLWLAMPVDHRLRGPVGLDSRRDAAIDRPWNPRTDAWPSLDASDFNCLDGDELLRNLLQARRKDTPRPDALLDLLQQTLGAAPEWRSSLLFLSRLELNRRTREVTLGAPDQRVVDQFFKHILQGKSPSLCHTMLAHLADRLRFHVILTTNFDDLLEKAFDQRGSRLVPFDVHLNGQLPAIELLREQLATVKLHGGRYGVRADYSLDAEPSADDLEHVLSYLTGLSVCTGDARLESGPTARNHLLVMGTSLSDRRIRAMIQYAWRRSPNLKVFWVCHTRFDLIKAKKFEQELERTAAAESPKTQRIDAKDCSPRFHCLRHSALGMLLLELYQRRHQAFPPSDIPFPAAARVALPPETVFPSELQTAPWFQDFVESIYRRWGQLRRRRHHRLVTVAGAPGVVGITSAVAEVFHRLTDEGVECIWLDLDDVVSADDLFEQILESVHTKAGVPDWVPMVQSTDPKSRGRILAHAAGHLGKEWVIFLNAREVPGINLAYDVGDEEPPISTYDEAMFETNGWLDFVHESPTGAFQEPHSDDIDSSPIVEPLRAALQHQKLFDRGTTSRRALIRLLHDLTGSECSRVSCILLCRDTAANSELESTVRQSKNQFETNVSLIAALEAEGYEKALVRKEASPSLDAASIHRHLRKLVNKNASDAFLLPLVLLRRTRYLAMLGIDGGDFPSRRDGGVWCQTMKRLEKIEAEIPGFIRRKPGGFVWLPCRFRDFVRREYAKKFHAKPGGWPRRLRACYEGLAVSCEQLHLATHSPTAAFETIYYALQAIAADLQDAEADEAALERRVRRAIALVLRVLTEAESRIMYLGFSKGRCRRLEQMRDIHLVRIRKLAQKRPLSALRDFLIEQADALRERCLSLKSKIAREVAEHRKGFQRQRELGRFLLNPELEDLSDEAHGSTLPALDRHELRISKPIEWIDWWRHVATLYIASRSYRHADLAFQMVLRIIPGLANGYEPASLQQVCEAFPDCEPNRLFTALGKLYVRRLQLRVAQCKLSQRLESTEASQAEQLVQAKRDYARAREFLDAVKSSAQWFEVHNNRRRAETYRALIEMSQSDGRSSAALSDLIVAERLALLLDRERRNLSHAAIELHRADVLISAALRMKPNGQEREAADTFGAWRLRMLSLAEPTGKGAGIDTRSRTAPANRQLRRVAAELRSAHTQNVRGILQYAFAALDRARPTLLQNERNVWWATWYFERRMKVIELHLWATVNENNMPIQFVGLEAAPSVTGTIIDELLEDTERMVRYDVYRFATVVDSYLNCLIALRVRLCCDYGDITDRLVQRQKAMHERLESAWDRLQELLAARRGLGQAQRESSMRLDPDVRKYVEGVCTRVQRAMVGTKRPVE